MAGGLEVLVVFWKEWGIQSLVLLSFALQVILLITAEIRQRVDSGVIRGIVWSAYLLADTTAIYALGHMSVSTNIRINSGSRLPEHQVVAFWAPFLLLHLGGQDNITAYSIEDNRLWLRHLQNFVLQVVAAGYVLYESPVVGRRPATILMFVAGVIKYGERVWALKCASSSHLSGKNYQSFGKLHVEYPGAVTSCGTWNEMYQVAEVQLSLMYEVFYSKAPVIHTWYGVCIRVISLMATVAGFLLFRGSSDQIHGYYYNRVDVAATYVLLVGSVILEITSLLRAMFSSWADADMMSLALLLDNQHGIPDCMWLLLGWFWRAIALPRFLIKYTMRKVGLPVKYWSGTMGQHNIIDMCTKSKDRWSSKIARCLGREDWWNMLVYTSAVPVPGDVSQLLMEQLLPSLRLSKEDPYHISNSRGRAALKGMEIAENDFPSWSVDIRLDESILVWHIATHVFLNWYNEKYSPRPALAMAIEVLSNYMVFLLASRPYMLPDNASRQSYVELCNKMINHLGYYNSAEDLVRLIQVHGEALNTTTTTGPSPDAADTEPLEENLTFDRASQLGAKLIRKGLETAAAGADTLQLIAQVWMEMLCYASYRCRADSHARRLSNGGEIATVVAILMEYMKSGFLEGAIDRTLFALGRSLSS